MMNNRHPCSHSPIHLDFQFSRFSITVSLLRVWRVWPLTLPQGFYPACHHILRAIRCACTMGPLWRPALPRVLSLPAAGLCQMHHPPPQAVPGLSSHSQASWKHHRQNCNSRAVKRTESEVRLSSWEFSGQSLLCAPGALSTKQKSKCLPRRVMMRNEALMLVSS